MLQGRTPADVFVVVGDSTSARFDGVVIEHASGPIVFKARWQPVSRVQDLWQDGKLSEYLTRILMEMRRVRRTQDPQWAFPRLPERVAGGGPEFNYEPRYAGRTVLLFSYGESDALDLAYGLHQGHFPQERTAEVAAERCGPLFDAIRALRGMGYENVFLHAFTPPAHGGEPPIPPYEVRLQVARTFTHVYEEFARETGTPLVSIWDELYSEAHGREPRYGRDLLHLNPDSAVLSARKLVEELERRGYYAGTGAQDEYPNSSMSVPYNDRTASTASSS